MHCCTFARRSRIPVRFRMGRLVVGWRNAPLYQYRRSLRLARSTFQGDRQNFPRRRIQ